MALTFSVASVTGKTYDVMVKGEDRVKELREEVERYIEVPEACYLKLFHGAEVLHDALPLTALDPTEQVFAVVARETKVELLLQAAGSYEGYKELLKTAPSSPEGDHIKVVKGLPSILAVLEDMAGQKPEIEHLRAGEHGLEMSSKDGHLLLPSINSGVLLRESRKEQFSKVVVSVQLNSDAYNKGLGLVVEEPPSMQSDTDPSGLPSYVYNGFGLSESKKSNAIKFHPAMHGGLLRIEGAGGFPNCNMGYTPLNWTESEKKFHTFEVTLAVDGRNHLKVTSTEGEVFQVDWRNKLTDGKFLPAVYAWLDLGGEALYLGDISLEIHL